MFFNCITIFAALLILLAPFTQAGVADCRMMTPGENPNLVDSHDLLAKFIAVCHLSPPRLPAMATECHKLNYKTSEIRICPPKNLDRRIWSTPVTHNCDDLFANIGSIMEQCHTVVSTGGRMNLGNAQYGYIIITRPGGPN
ncbi:uncharacterized protein LAJ45_07722 [Morchella importuna]|uniref:uncharacterized protein n=1 Tax=Morchella importuna TaxID=1174673 RepID=UPI001E8E0773|nr:uncharacterized protein LAJ45_07722 [Morchella importuna]KAH8148269.1 hypothetical protein LAJ45_07722 [Morchella importuna]